MIVPLALDGRLLLGGYGGMTAECAALKVDKSGRCGKTSSIPPRMYQGCFTPTMTCFDYTAVSGVASMHHILVQTSPAPRGGVAAVFDIYCGTSNTATALRRD